MPMTDTMQDVQATGVDPYMLSIEHGLSRWLCGNGFLYAILVKSAAVQSHLSRLDIYRMAVYPNEKPLYGILFDPVMPLSIPFLPPTQMMDGLIFNYTGDVTLELHCYFTDVQWADNLTISHG